MALTVESGPFGERSKGTFNFDTTVLQPHTLYFEDFPRRVRVMFDGETVADSRHVKFLHETGPPADLLLPRGGRAYGSSRSDRPRDIMPLQGRR
jgi:hypothetical protein